MLGITRCGGGGGDGLVGGSNHGPEVIAEHIGKSLGAIKASFNYLSQLAIWEVTALQRQGVAVGQTQALNEP